MSTTLNNAAWHVISGDSIYVTLHDGKTSQVKLRGVDAPDSGQPFRNESRDALRKLILDKKVEVRWIERDSTSAMIADVYLEDHWINLQLVAEGWAWFNDNHFENDELRKAQDDAQKARLNIWSFQNPVPPWEYRMNQRDRELAAIDRAARNKAELKRIADEAKERATREAAESYSSYGTGGFTFGGGSVSVRGHYRTSKTGRSYYVKPYTRRK